MMIDDETEVRDLEAEMDLAMEAVRKAVLRLLQDGEVGAIAESVQNRPPTAVAYARCQRQRFRASRSGEASTV
jgi:hypothetical protein